MIRETKKGIPQLLDNHRDPPAPFQVAILLFDAVEVLDFAGPFEVFGVASREDDQPAFEVQTVSLTPDPIVARNGLMVLPSRRPETLAAVDILVVPGGFGTRRLLADNVTLDFIRMTNARASLTLSVCSGSLLLAAAGLLDGKAATTHWGAIEELRTLAPHSRILPGARIVDNGDIVTSAGVSAGIDASLHVVSRLLGQQRANACACYMDYERLGVTVATT